MESEESEQGPFWHHGHMDEDMHILTVEEEGHLHLEKVRVVLDEQVPSGLVCSLRQLPEEVDQFCRV